MLRGRRWGRGPLSGDFEEGIIEGEGNKQMDKSFPGRGKSRSEAPRQDPACVFEELARGPCD